MPNILELLPEEASGRAQSNDDGFGALLTEAGALPLVALSVNARLEGLIASVEVRQTFVNSATVPLEATFIFPLPDRAAVTAFQLQVAGKLIDAVLQERNQARQEYAQAIQSGHRAAIAEEERPGVFAMRVGNLPPGEKAVVRLTLVGPLPFNDNEVTFRFPLVVAPRYIPGVELARGAVGAGTSQDTDQTPDASRISPPVLLPGQPNPVQLNLVVDVPEDGGLAHSFRSSLHTVRDESGPGGRRFRVVPGARLDRDFILRYRLGSDRIATSLTVRPDAQGEEGTFLLTLVPPRVSQTSQRPRDIVFVLDRSGSMGGWKMVTARRAVARMVETLSDQDRFTVFAFDNSIEVPPGFPIQQLIPATNRERFGATEYLGKVEARGGTEMAEPLHKAVELLTRESGERDRVLVLITDGQVGNEDHILRQLGERVRAVRVFTLGIDRAVNAAFLRRLSDLGGGTSQVVESDARLDEVMDSVHRHIGTGVLTHLEVMPRGMEVLRESVTPTRLPDLFTGAIVLIAGRYRGKPEGALCVRGKNATGDVLSLDVPARVSLECPLAQVWARGRVRDLEDRFAVAGRDPRLEREIVETSLRFGVLSRFTAFVAVDRSEVVNQGGFNRQIVQPVEPPSGWNQTDGGPMSGGVLFCRAAPSKVDRMSARTPARPMADMDSDRSRQANARADSVPTGARPANFKSLLQERVQCCMEPSRPRKGAGWGLLALCVVGFSVMLSLALFLVQNKTPEPLTRQTVTPRVTQVLEQLEAAEAETPGARLEVLRASVADLETLAADLRHLNDSPGTVAQLEAALAVLRELLVPDRPMAGIESDCMYMHIVFALQEWRDAADADLAR